MGFPKLNRPILCRILSYVVVLGCGMLPIFLVFSLPVPDIIKVLVLFGALIGLLVYLAKNFIVLMAMDMTLASLSCYRTARKRYTLPQGRTVTAIRRSILRYGISCDPVPAIPQPSALRYKFSSPLTVYSRGIERVVTAYEIDYLDREIYRNIFSSAKANSKALVGKKKALFLDSAQKKSPLHRVTVLLILAHRVDSQLQDNLYKLVCKQCGDESEDCIVPCVVDLSQSTCVFNSMRLPYAGYGYPVKNRGIRIIKNRVFGGNLNLDGNAELLPTIRDIDLEYSLWDLWEALHHQLIGASKETKRLFDAMADREIRLEDEFLYLKWDHWGIRQTVKLDTENKIAQIESISNWYYPKLQPIGKKTIQKIENHISTYFTQQGYCVNFSDTEVVA